MSASSGRRWLFWGALGLELALFVGWQWAHLGGFQWTTDEGLYAMRARLLQQGFALYRDIWTDQFPGMVQIVQLAFALGGGQIESARAAVVLIAAVGLGSAAVVARRLSGDLGALLVAPVVALVPNYYWLSRAVISPDLPATSLAVASLALMMAYTGRRRRWLLLTSGLVMSLALYVKASAVLVAAPCVLWLWQQRAGRPAPLQEAVVWGLAVALPLAVALAWQHPAAMWQQFVATQLESAGMELKIGSHAVKIGAYLREHWGLAALGVAGLLVAVVNRRPARWLAGTWLAAAVLVLLVRSPMWPKHHLSVLLYPLGIAGAGAFEALAAALRSRKIGLPTALALLGIGAQLAALPGIVTADATLAEAPTYESTLHAVRFLEERYPEGAVVISDYHMIPFRAGCTVPPELATVTKKRIQLGLLGADTLIRVAQEDDAQVILLWDEQLDSSEAFTAWARERYGLAFKWGYHDILCAPRPGEALYEAQIDLGSVVRLERYGVRQLVAAPGGAFEIVLYWRVLQPMDERLHGFVHLVDEQGRLVAQQDQVAFSNEHNSQAWRAGELLEDVYRIDVPADAVAGPYAFSVGLYDDASRERLQATARDTGAPLGGQITLQPRPIVRWPGLYEQPASEHGCDYRFGEVGALVGWSTRAEAGTLMLELVWQAATAPATPEYVVFAHLRQGDALVAQHDGPPAEGKRPTVGWRQGEYVVDRRQIDLAGVPAGEYALYVGLYDPLTGERVSALDDGVALPSSEVLLGQIEVAP
jgi:hypothetical protein